MALETSEIDKKSIGLTGFLLIAYAFSLSLPITFPWTILVVGIISMLILIGLETIRNKQSLTEELRYIFSGELVTPIIIFIFAVSISGIANGGLSEGWKSFTSSRGMLVYLWASWAFIRNPVLKELCIGAILAAGALAGITSTVEQLTGFHPFSVPYLQGTGFLSGPMAFSGLAQMFSLLALGLAFRKAYSGFHSKLSSPYIFIPILICNWLGVIFAGERSAWIGAAVALLVVSFIVSRRAAVLACLSVIATTIAGWLILPVVRERLVSLLNWQADVSVSTRLILWDKAWQLFIQSPLFGTGIRHFPHIRIEEALRQGHVALDHAHNNYLHILATTGLIGFTAYLYLWFSALLIAYKAQKDTTNSLLERGIYLGILGGIVSLAVSGLFEYNFGTGQIRLTQWFLLAMLNTNTPRKSITDVIFPRHATGSAKN